MRGLKKCKPHCTELNTFNLRLNTCIILDFIYVEHTFSFPPMVCMCHTKNSIMVTAVTLSSSHVPLFPDIEMKAMSAFLGI